MILPADVILIGSPLVLLYDRFHVVTWSVAQTMSSQNQYFHCVSLHEVFWHALTVSPSLVPGRQYKGSSQVIYII